MDTINMDMVNIIKNLDATIVLKIALGIFVALMIGFYSIPIVIKIAIKKDMVAKPNHRTSHTGRIPNVGGIAVFIAFILAYLTVAGLENFYGAQYFLLAIIVFFFIGIQDDILITSATKKLIGEVLTLLLVIIVGKIRISELHGFFGIYTLPYLVSIILTLFVFIVIINAMNLIDGIDGLASGLGILISSFYGFYFLLEGSKLSNALSIVSFCLSGSLIPFFLYNVFGKRNKIFMGDVGSLVLGIIVAVLTIQFVEVNAMNYNSKLHITNVPMVAICVLMVPLFDTLRVFTIRAMQKKSPFSPDRNHLHHMLLDCGFKHRKSTAILIFSNFCFIITGILLQNIDRYVFFGIIVMTAIILTEILRYMAKKLKEHKPIHRNVRTNTK